MSRTVAVRIRSPLVSSFVVEGDAGLKSRRLLRLFDHNTQKRFLVSAASNATPSTSVPAPPSVTASPPPPLLPPTSENPSPAGNANTPPSKPPSSSSSFSWNSVKFGASAAVAGMLGTTAYATYAYSLDELEEKLKRLQANSSYSVGDDASAFEKFQAKARSVALKVPAKSIELYIDIRRAIEDQIRDYTEPSADKLLPDLHPSEQGVFTLVLDLNETLVYSDWNRDRGWRTFKRPGVDHFLEHLAKFYEIVVYSDQLSMYVDPVVERLDQKGCIRYRLARNATRYQNGKHYRDLSKLNRDPSRVIYISAHALENSLQPENSVQVKAWKLESDDTALLDLIPFLEYVGLYRPSDIRNVLASYQGGDVAHEFMERSKEHRRRAQEQKQHGKFWRR